MNKMASGGRIRGITIELNGDTTGLTQALKKVDGEAKSIQTELNDVQRLLKFDPTNTELLAQKQKLLGNAIDNTSTRLDALRQAQAEVQAQYERGDIGEDAFRRFQREIVATEGKLKAFKSQANSLNPRIEPKVDTSGVDKMKLALKELGPAAKDAAREISSTLGTAGAAGAAAVTGLVAGTSELNSDLARLRTNAEMAGRDINVVEEAFKKVTAVTGEADSAVETVSNILASGFKDNQMQSVIEGINGAAIKFSDTLKTEGIADGIQETFATGKSIGMFAELLERSGVNVEAFDKKLAAAKKTGTETDLLLQTFAELGLTKVNDKYKEMNPEIVANAEATTNMQMALADLAVILTPLITSITLFVTELVKWATANPELVLQLVSLLGAIAGITGAFAMLSPIVTTIATLLPPLAAAFGAITLPIAGTILAIAGLAAAFIALWQNSETFRTNITNVFESIKSIAMTIFETIASFIGEKIAQILQFWSENGQQILQAVENLFNGIKAVVDFAMPAVLFIVDMVWTAIKNVINGALDVIMGAVKIFTGIFTGDFSKMWEGVKQLFSGAIDLIMGLMTLSFVGGIRSLITNLAKSGTSLIKGMWDDILGVFKTMGNNVRSFTDDTLSKVIGFFRNFTTNVKSKITEAKDGVINIWNQAVTFLKNIDLKQIGKDIIQGLINGIGSMASMVTDKIKEIANLIPSWAKDVLGIHSPSRVMAEVGKWTGLGLVEGLNSTQSDVQKSIEDLGGILIDVAENNIQQEKEIRKKADAEILKLRKDAADKIAELEKKSSDKVLSIQESASKKKKGLTDSQQRTILSSRKDTANKVLKIEEETAAKIAKIEAKAVSDSVKLISANQKEILEEIKLFISDKQSLEELNLVQEAALWEKSISLFEEGTKERVEAQKAYQKAVKTINDEIVSINTDYQTKIKQIDDNLVKNVEAATKEYTDALKKRQQDFAAFAGTFDEFAVELNRSGIEMITNLQAQVDGIKQWQTEFDKLSNRGVNGDLLNELSELGVKALPELVALNSMTDEQLSKFSALYQEKAQLARTQAETELAGMKADTETKITEMRKVADSELSKLHTEWTAKIKNVTQGTKTELSTLKQIGVDAGNGLLEGLSSTAGAIQEKAMEIANSIRDTIQSALDIHSPSRVTMGFGVNVNEGLIKGIEQSSGRLQRAMNNVYGSLASSATRSAEIAQGTSTDSGSTSTTSIPTQVTEQHFHMSFTSPKALDPYESARLARNALKEAGLHI